VAERVRVLLVDDEAPARSLLREYLGAHEGVEVIGESVNGFEAVKAISEQRPDLVFLDVQMPKLDGFEVLELVAPEPGAPAVIFCTAYDEYALRAFEVHAVDYLLKPFGAERFRDALQRARTRVRDRERGRRLVPLLEELAARPAPPERLEVRSSARIAFVRTDDVDYAEACGNYVLLHCGAERHLMRETMQALEARLDPRRFVRIHRSTLVNADRVKEIHPLFHGDWEVVLRNGERLTMTRTHRERAQRLLTGRL